MRIITALLMSFFILPVHAGVVIYGTRIIYPEKNREVLVQLMNQSKNASLIQAWIDWICPYISRHLLSLNPLLACCRRYSRGER
ncbi:hypothetical protein EYY14_16185 [Escherichia coli]|nr:hypothetical protein EYY14_16185 [Escherichia coli]TIJ93521.1 hypothetical protein EYY03_14615 [Escherichia coli]TLD65517.1 hypothetical protein EYY34_14360 [Escherichia coli]